MTMLGNKGTKRLVLWSGIVTTALLSCALGEEVDELTSYPKSDKIWLGAYGGEVEVNPREELKVNRFGTIDWKVEDGKDVKKGQTLAYSAAEEAWQSERQVAIEESSLKLNLKKAEWDHYEAGLGMERKVAELKGRLSRITLSDHEKKLLGDELAVRVVEQRAKIREEIRVAEEKLEPDFRAVELQAKLAQVQHDYDQVKWSHRELIHGLSLLAPHDGVLHRVLNGEVKTGDVVGSVERRGRAAVTMKIADPQIRTEAPESLGISVADSRGRLYQGDFSKIEKLEGVSFAPDGYEFSLLSRDGKALPDELSGERMVTIYKKLKQEAYIVPKAKFLFSHPDEIRSMGWSRFLKTIWPKARVLHVGPSSIAIVEPE